jgi:hypothetical protein
MRVQDSIVASAVSFADPHRFICDQANDGVQTKAKNADTKDVCNQYFICVSHCRLFENNISLAIGAFKLISGIAGQSVRL